MAASIRYRPDRKAVRELQNSEGARSALVKYAEAGKGFAASVGPRRTGRYDASFVVESRLGGGPRGDQAEATLSNQAEYAVYLEFGTRNHHGERVLGRTVDFIEHQAL